MRNLEVSDIFSGSEENKLLAQKEKPNIDSVQFDVHSHLIAILDNMGQKFIIERENENQLKQSIDNHFESKSKRNKKVSKINTTNKKNIKKYSLMDIRNFKLLNKEKIKELFIKGFGIDLESDSGLQELNKYYTEAKRIFCNRYGKNLPYNLKQELHGVDDIERIFNATGSTLHGVYYCALAKIFYGYASFMKDSRINKIDNIHEEINGYLFSSIHSQLEVDEGRIDGNINIDGKDLNVSLMHRSKTIDSIVGKASGNIDYNEVDDYKDLHGYTFDVDTKKDEDIILLMQQYYLKLLPKSKIIEDENGNFVPDIEIENKNMIQVHKKGNGKLYIPALIRLKDQLDTDFYEIMEKSIIKSIEKSRNKAETKNTDHKYQDIKFKVQYSTNDPRGKDLENIYSGVEIKFTKKGNENEKGSAFHPIFDYSKRFRELTRLVGYIRHTDILNFVNDFFNNLGSTLNYKGMNRGPYLKDLLIDLQNKGFIDKNIKYKIGCVDSELEIRKGLYRMYESTLKKVKSSKNARKHFYIHPSYYDLVPEIQPDLYEI